MFYRNGRQLSGKACCLLLPLVLTTNAEASFELELIGGANTVSQVTGGVSINSSGSVAFAGTRLSDGTSRLFYWNCDPVATVPCNLSPNAISFGGAGREFLGAILNDEDPPWVVSRDRVAGSPPTLFLRRWLSSGTETSPTFETLGRSSGSNPAFSSVTSFLDIDGDGNVLASTFEPLSTTPSMQMYLNGTQGQPDNKLIFPAGATLRPQMAAEADRVVIKTHLDQVQTLTKTLQFAEFIAGNSNGFSQIGAFPGISSDGNAVAFLATKNGKVGVYLWVKSGTSSNIFPVADEGKGISLSATTQQRIGVVARWGAPYVEELTKVPRRFLHVSVVFVAAAIDPPPSPQPALPVEGVWMTDLLIESRTTNSGDVIKLGGRAPMTPIARVGDVIQGKTISGGFVLRDPVAMLRGGDPNEPNDDLHTPVVAFSATIGSLENAAFRAVRRCHVGNTLTNHRQFESSWGSTILGFSPGKNTITKAGCRLTSITNVLNHLKIGVALNPLNLNEMLKGETPVGTDQNGQPVFIDPSNGFAGGDVKSSGIVSYASSQGVAIRQDWFSVGAVPEQSIPGEVGNVNDEALSPVADYFICNGEPLIVKVANCFDGSKYEECSTHFVVAKSKESILQTGQTVKNVSVGINDPGHGTPPVTDLIQRFSPFKKYCPGPKCDTGSRTRRNRIYAVEPITRLPGNTTTPASLTLTLQSPAHVLVTDPIGRRVGFNPSNSDGFLDVPNAYYADKSFSDPDGTALMSHAKELYIGPPEDALGNINAQGDGVMDGTYSIEVVGTGPGAFTLTVSTTDSSGLVATRTIQGMTDVGVQESIFINRSSTPGVAIQVDRPQFGARGPGDVNYDGKVDLDDIALIQKALNRTSDSTSDPRDLDGDGAITALDARRAVLHCKNPRCAK